MTVWGFLRACLPCSRSGVEQQVGWPMNKSKHDSRSSDGRSGSGTHFITCRKCTGAFVSDALALMLDGSEGPCRNGRVGGR
ncbi:hypothetical protein BS50DRAFT_569128 [Corynespora cassiicola Philippines]|uniref:Uncharacterized protein n=1 Tax=Corynespora cassiicola Philippines TaxID=1448308 RepID=A0A2T2P8D2_CORCC|nr:hypothetical protein BS50DRAFT_569128 [Corynespora cassiicola Philippines]